MLKGFEIQSSNFYQNQMKIDAKYSKIYQYNGAHYKILYLKRINVNQPTLQTKSYFRPSKKLFFLCILSIELFNPVILDVSGCMIKLYTTWVHIVRKDQVNMSLLSTLLYYYTFKGKNNTNSASL